MLQDFNRETLAGSVGPNHTWESEGNSNLSKYLVTPPASTTASFGHTSSSIHLKRWLLACMHACALLVAVGMKEAMTKLKQQAADLAARAAADAEQAAQYRSQAEREYNSIASELEAERQQVRCMHSSIAWVGWDDSDTA